MQTPRKLSFACPAHLVEAIDRLAGSEEMLPHAGRDTARTDAGDAGRRRPVQPGVPVPPTATNKERHAPCNHILANRIPLRSRSTTTRRSDLLPRKSRRSRRMSAPLCVLRLRAGAVMSPSRFSLRSMFCVELPPSWEYAGSEFTGRVAASLERATGFPTRKPLSQSKLWPAQSSKPNGVNDHEHDPHAFHAHMGGKAHVRHLPAKKSDVVGSAKPTGQRAAGSCAPSRSAPS